MPKQAPKHLGKEGSKLWKAVVKQFELGPAEARILEDACREVDLIEKLEEELRDPATELTVTGSMGQPVSNPLIQEVRQHRGMVKTLLAALKLPDDPETEAREKANRSQSAREAAMARWRKPA